MKPVRDSTRWCGVGGCVSIALIAVASCRTAPTYPPGLPEPKPSYRNSQERKAGDLKKDEEQAALRAEVSRQRELQLDALLARREIAAIATIYDRRLGREAFRSELVNRAQLAWKLKQEDLPPQMALIELMNTDAVAEEIARSQKVSFRLKIGMRAAQVRDLFGSPRQVQAIRGLVRNTKTGEKTLTTFTEWTFDTRPCRSSSSGKSFERCKLTFDQDLLLFEQVGVDPKYLDLDSAWQSSDPTGVPNL